MKNLYHVYHKMPALEKEEMFIGLEQLATNLVESGLLRIDADLKRNFARFSMPSRNVHINLSKRELYDEKLYQRVFKQLSKPILESGFNGDIQNKVKAEIEKLKIQLKKSLEVEQELEIKLARILVQSAHPIVFTMIIFKEVQVFVSYGENIGDVMDIVTWKQAGNNSGMQSTDGKDAAVFVSCGGDPLLLDPVLTEEEINKKKLMPDEIKTYGDGTPALARMMGIAGQETGHFSDIKYNFYGQQAGRHSANFSGTRADPKVDLARNTDMKNILTFRNLAKLIGIEKLIDQEKKIQFFSRNPNKNLIFRLKYLWMNILKTVFIWRAKRRNLWPVAEFKKEKYLGTSLIAFFDDMAFNLAPEADVYSSPDKNVETAIACIEALARVPQQVNKWGHKNTLFIWRNLYKFYYYKVIPRCVADYERMSGLKFNLYPHNLKKFSLIDKLVIKFIKWKNKRFKKSN